SEFDPRRFWPEKDQDNGPPSFQTDVRSSRDVLVAMPGFPRTTVPVVESAFNHPDRRNASVRLHCASACVGRVRWIPSRKGNRCKWKGTLRKEIGLFMGELRLQRWRLSCLPECSLAAYSGPIR